MKCNIGKADRIARIVIGIVLIVSGYYLAGTAGTILGLVGLIPLFTGMAGNCPAYALFRINTCENMKPGAKVS